MNPKLKILGLMFCKEKMFNEYTFIEIKKRFFKEAFYEVTFHQNIKYSRFDFISYDNDGFRIWDIEF